jgi:Fur family zinc uptake transcriptional regulator
MDSNKKHTEKKDKAILICMEKQETLTPNRLLILNILLENEKPISAYDINEIIKKRGKSLNISSVYRVIEFWVKLNVIHKISYLNKYMLCDNTDEKHTHITNICTSCMSVIETCNESMGLDLIKSSKKLGVVLSPDINIEIPIICQNCQ